MPKMKSNRGLRKRFKVTKKGKVTRKQAFKSHLMSTKTGKRRRQLKKVILVCKADQKKILRMMCES